MIAHLPTRTWLLTPGQSPSSPARMIDLLDRKLVIEASTGARVLVGPTLQVPVPKWSSGTPRGYLDGVDPSILFHPTAWLNEAARTAAADPVSAVCLGNWLVSSGWYNPENAEWLSPFNASVQSHVSGERAARWLGGYSDPELDAIQSSLPAFSCSSLEIGKHENTRIARAATATAARELLGSIDIALSQPEEENTAQTHILAAQLLHLPPQVLAPEEFNEPLPASVVIPSIGVALANDDVDPTSALLLLRSCLVTAITWLERSPSSSVD